MVSVQAGRSLDSSPLVPVTDLNPTRKPCCGAWQVLVMFALLLVPPLGCMLYDSTLGKVRCEGASSIWAGCSGATGRCKHHHYLNYLDDPVAFGCNETDSVDSYCYQERSVDCFKGCPSAWGVNCGCPDPCPQPPYSNPNASAAENQRLGEDCVRQGFGRWVSDEANCTEPHVQQCEPISSDWSAISVPSYGGECQADSRSFMWKPCVMEKTPGNGCACLCKGPYWVDHFFIWAYIVIWMIGLCCCGLPIWLIGLFKQRSFVSSGNSSGF
eukprot:SAG31_NODE_12374_length_946_cov_1.421488_1_plen_269_part_01